MLRFLRFQAPWAYGRKLFALLRRAPVENWANVCYRLMDVAEKRLVRDESACPKRRNMGLRVMKNAVLRWRNGVWRRCCQLQQRRQAGFSKRVGEGLLTKFCKRPHPRSAVFGIIARCKRLGGSVSFCSAGQGARGPPENRR